MSKKETRQHGIRNKLFAAIAMLLVSSIMVVSTTYAWFTLSTAPEVQGITTTVGANGNLEIALMPYDGDVNKVTSSVGDSTIADNFVKNMTWGNLIDLNDTEYALESITLMPARLNMAGDKVNSTPLKTPVYGADGRVSTLAENTSIGARSVTEENGGYIFGEAWEVGTTAGGVRAIGTSSTMSEYEVTFNNNLSKMASLMGDVQDKAEASLINNGATLADMAIAHVTVSGEDTQDYSAYLDEMTNVIDELQAANNSLEQAIRAAILAAAASSASNEAGYAALKSLVENEENLATVWTTVSTYADIINALPLAEAYSTWSSVQSKLNDSTDAIAIANTEIADSYKLSWGTASTILNNLMNTAGLKIGGENLADFKKLVSDGTSTTKPDDLTDEAWQAAKKFVSALASNVSIELSAGSGVYYDLSSAAGNIDASIVLPQIAYGGMALYDVKATIKTSAGTATLESTRTALALLGAYNPDGGAATNNVLDTTYGYIVDFLFRTNATGSSLRLQTEAAQRVYEDSASAATMGHGSTMTFTTGKIDLDATKRLMEAVRVVFMDYSTMELYGIAKLDMSTLTQNVITEANAETDTAEVIEVTAKLYLYDYTDAVNADTGVMTLTNKAASDTLCDLPANTAKAVSAMVYLDGDYVTNADVASEAPSLTGTLNLQFASSANLVPMENSGLKNMVGEDEEVIESIWKTVTFAAEGLEEGQSVAVTVNCLDRDSLTTMTLSNKTITLTYEQPSQQIEVAEGDVNGTPVVYKVVKVEPTGYTATETSDNNWVIAPEVTGG